MPVYEYRCKCGSRDLIRRINDRDAPLLCTTCGERLERQVAAPMGRIAGRVPQGGGMDRFTADMLGIPLKELPSGLKGMNDLG